MITKIRFHLPTPASIIDSETILKSGKKLVKGISNQEKEQHSPTLLFTIDLSKCYCHWSEFKGFPDRELTYFGATDA